MQLKAADKYGERRYTDVSAAHHMSLTRNPKRLCFADSCLHVRSASVAAANAGDRADARGDTHRSACAVRPPQAPLILLARRPVKCIVVCSAPCHPDYAKSVIFAVIRRK